MRRRNPYIVGPVVRHPDFYGRQALAEDLLDERQKCIYLVGNRRTGKTSLLQYLEDVAPCVTLFLNFQGTDGDPVRLGAKLVRQIEDKTDQFPELHKVHFDGTDICDVIIKLSQAARADNYSVLLLLDEAEELLELSQSHLNRLHSILQDERPLRTILTATKELSKLNDQFRPWKTSPFLFGFTTRYISPLSDSEAIGLICQSNNPDGCVEVSESLQSQILELTGNHPYLIQFLCSRLFETTGKLHPVTDRDLVMDNQVSDLFQVDYDFLSPSERAILRQLSLRSSLSEEMLCHSLRIDLDKLRSHIYGLEQLGYIRYNDGKYQVANYFLDKWLKGYVRETPELVSDRASLEVVGRDHLTTEQRNKLRQNLDSTFGDKDLRDLCFDLGLDYESLPAEGKSGKVRELIAELERKGRILELIEMLRRLRPNTEW